MSQQQIRMGRFVHQLRSGELDEAGFMRVASEAGVPAERARALARETLVGVGEDPELDIFCGIVETLRALVPASGALMLGPRRGRVSQGLCGVGLEYAALRPEAQVLDSAFEWATQYFGQLPGQVCMGGEPFRNMVMALGSAAFRSLATDSTRLLVVCFSRHSLPLGLAALVRAPLEAPFLQEDCQQVEKLVPLVASILWRENGQPQPEAPPETAILSEREREVSRLLVMGYSSVNVAAITGLSENTIKT
ncbi:MAG TPA: LuxR C-terminal-related transcriptional regulator, partial [Archangium sp.]|nr:LuxR C-terminal-related transcriptional regulator [Archangium sp.]